MRPATLNRLGGEDVPAKRAGLLAELTGLGPQDERAALVPEDASSIEETISLIELDTDALLAELSAAAERSEEAAPRLLSFAVLPADEEAVERAIGLASDGLDGRNRRGRALALVCRGYLEARDA